MALALQDLQESLVLPVKRSDVQSQARSCILQTNRRGRLGGPRHRHGYLKLHGRRHLERLHLQQLQSYLRCSQQQVEAPIASVPIRPPSRLLGLTGQEGQCGRQELPPRIRGKLRKALW